MTTLPSPTDTLPTTATVAEETLVGEVVESTTASFQAQACELDGAPPFGAFVRVSQDDGSVIYGVVARVETCGIDPGARPIMRGHGEVRDDLIYQENPDLPHVLRTTFQALIVGFEREGEIRQYLPAQPPRLHYSVHRATDREVRAFTDAGLDYLATLLGASEGALDELIAASVRLASASRGEPTFAHLAGRELAQLLRADYPRLARILRRMVPGQ